MNNARLILELPCGCRSALYEGDVVGIPFGRLPTYVAEFVDSINKRGCTNCPSLAHTG
jgi:hypothetical protein